jgi:hypothetical protein
VVAVHHNDKSCACQPFSFTPYRTICRTSYCHDYVLREHFWNIYAYTSSRSMVEASERASRATG